MFAEIKAIISLSCICNDEYTFRGLFLEQTYNFYKNMYMYIINYIILITKLRTMTLQWHHNERDGVSNHRRLDCLLNRLFWRRSKKTSKLRVTGLCDGNSPVTGEFPAQRVINAENASIWLRGHEWGGQTIIWVMSIVVCSRMGAKPLHKSIAPAINCS